MDKAFFAENLVAQYRISVKSNILGSPGVDLGPKRDDESWGSDEFPQYRAFSVY